MAPGRPVHAPCCRRRRLQVEATLQGAARRAAGAVASAACTASRAVGAAGGGWALLAALRAAREAAGLALKVNQQCDAADACVRQDGGQVPHHVAVIMDGNRRFGRRKYGEALSGHRAGGEKLRDFLVWCVEEGVQVLTVFAFSTENWKREENEVAAMMRLFLNEVPRLGEHTTRLNTRVRFISSDDGPIPAELKSAMKALEERSSSCTGLQLNVCLSYGGRGDVSSACKQLAKEAVAGHLDVDAIDEGEVARRLLTRDVPDPDILIRTSGERRLSNFLMYQLAYTELFFLDKHWPEVTRADFLEVIATYKERHRRYGA